MDVSVEDRIGECRLADGLVPVFGWKLCSNHRRSFVVEIVEDFQKVAPTGFV